MNPKNYIEENQKRFLEELFTLLRIPSISSESEHKEDMIRCAERWRELILAVRQSSEVRSLRDIQGQRVGTIDDPLLEASVKSSESVTRYASGATVYLTPERCLEALDKGWCAAIAMDSIMLSHLA